MHRPYQEQLVLGTRVVGSSATGSSSTSPSLPMFALSTAATVAAATAASTTAVTSTAAVSSFHHGVGGGGGAGGGSGHHHHLQVVPPHIPPPNSHHFSLSHHLNQPPAAPQDSSPGFSNPSKVLVQSTGSSILIQQQQQQQQHQIQSKHHQLMQQLGLGRSSEDSDPAGSDQNYGPPKSSQPIQQQQQAQTGGTGVAGVAGGVNSSVVSREISSAGGEDDPGMDDGERGGMGGGPRWLKEETSALIKIRIDMDRSFRDSPLKGPLWEEVSRKLGELGYQRSSKKCKEKFENVYKYYKKSKDGRAGRQDGKSYRFFADMEALFSTAGAGGGGGGVGGGASNSTTPVSTTPLATNILHGGLNSNAPGPNTSNNRLLAFQHELNNPGNSTTPSSLQLTALETTTNTGEDDTTETSDEVDEDDEYEDVVHTSNNDHMLSRKRKRGGTARWGVIEAMMRQLLERQESMQKRFLEAMEKRDAERTARDEAWRRQEAVRVRREQELRAQEQTRVATRDAALMAFLHKACSGGIPPAQSQQLLATLASLLSNNPTAGVADRTADIAPQQVVEDHHHHHQPLATTHGSTMDAQHDVVTVRGDSTGFDPASKRWPKPEVLALIKLRSNMENKFQETGPKGPLWEEISAGMSCLGYSRSSKRCKEKWENINKYFRKTKDSSKKRPENSKTCPYFHQLDALYRKGILGGTRMLTAGSLGSKREDEKTGGGSAGQPQGGSQSLGQPNQGADMLAIVPTTATNGGGENTNSGAAAAGSVGSPRNNGGFSGPDEDEDEEDNMSTGDKEMSNTNENGNHGTSTANVNVSATTTNDNGPSQQQPSPAQQQLQQQGKGAAHSIIGLLDSSNGHHPHQHHHHHYPTPLAMSCEGADLFSASSNMLGEFERREQQQQQQQPTQQNGRR